MTGPLGPSIAQSSSVALLGAAGVQTFQSTAIYEQNSVENDSTVKGTRENVILEENLSKILLQNRESNHNKQQNITISAAVQKVPVSPFNGEQNDENLEGFLLDPGADGERSELPWATEYQQHHRLAKNHGNPEVILLPSQQFQFQHQEKYFSEQIKYFQAKESDWANIPKKTDKEIEKGAYRETQDANMVSKNLALLRVEDSAGYSDRSELEQNGKSSASTNRVMSSGSHSLSARSDTATASGHRGGWTPTALREADGRASPAAFRPFVREKTRETR